MVVKVSPDYYQKIKDILYSCTAASHMYHEILYKCMLNIAYSIKCICHLTKLWPFSGRNIHRIFIFLCVFGLYGM